VIPLEQNSVKLEHLRRQTALKRLRLQLLSSQVFAALQNPKIPKRNAFVLRHRQTNHCM
jgi:hypothetical protein